MTVARERRLRPEGEGRPRRERAAPGARGAEDGAPRRLRRRASRCSSRAASASASRSPLDGQPAEGTAARRAARRARPEAPRRDAGVTEGAQQRPRHDLYLRHARPGRSAVDERPRRGLQPRPDRAGRRPRDLYERPPTEFVADFVGTSILFERNGRRFSVRPERIELNGHGEPGNGLRRGVRRRVHAPSSSTPRAGERLTIVQAGPRAQSLEPGATRPRQAGTTPTRMRSNPPRKTPPRRRSR